MEKLSVLIKRTKKLFINFSYKVVEIFTLALGCKENNNNEKEILKQEEKIEVIKEDLKTIANFILEIIKDVLITYIKTVIKNIENESISLNIIKSFI